MNDDLTLENIATARNLLVYISHEPARRTLHAALDQAEATLMEPITFKTAPNNCWLVGKRNTPVAGNSRGLLAAFMAIAKGHADLREFVFEDEAAGADSLRRAIHTTCVKWAEKEAHCPELARAFLKVEVEAAQNRVVYSGPWKFDTGF